MAKQPGNSRTARKQSEAEAPNAKEAFEKALEKRSSRRAEYILRLYVTGSSPRSLKAVYNLKKLCEEYLPDNYDLEVIDIYEDPAAARSEQIIAAPTLIKQLPMPLRRFVGDLSDTRKLLVGLDLYKRQKTDPIVNA
jgi:circadian clock protein KaiB